MGHTLTLEVPENIYGPLAKTAKLSGRSPEEWVLQWLITAIRTALEDPVENFIGAFRSDIPDWSDQHDKYIGQTMMEEIHGKDEGN
jgi:hypothetical protein